LAKQTHQPKALHIRSWISIVWNNRATQRSEFAPIFDDIQELASSFSSFCIVHVKRTANRAAHACAHFAASSAFEFWANDAPSFCIVHVKLTANRAAHACAHFAASSAFEFWANDAPSFLLQILQDDCNHANE